MAQSKMKFLIVTYLPASFDKTRPNVFHHLKSLEYDSNYDIVYYNTFEEAPYWLDFLSPAHQNLSKNIRKEKFDAVILHYTFLSVRTVGYQFYRWKPRFQWIADLKCPIVAIPQDEGNYVNLLDEWLSELGTSVIFSIHYKNGGPLYPLMKQQSQIYPCLPGYIDTKTAEIQAPLALPIHERPNDIVYRSMRLPLRYGRAGQVKSLIADKVLEIGTQLGLKLDVESNPVNPIPGNQWFDFLRSGRCVIGCQGGYSAIDWVGELAQNIKNMLLHDSSLSLCDLEKKLPKGWDQYNLLTITPRHFEAVMTKTAQLLVEGEYKGVLEANKHYLSIKPDFSNLEEVLETVRDHQKLQTLADQAYQDICQNKKYHYETFAKEIVDAIKNSEKRSYKIKNFFDNKEDKSMFEIKQSIITQRHQNILLEGKLEEVIVAIQRTNVAVQLTKKQKYLAFLAIVGSSGLIILILLINIILNNWNKF